MALMDASRYEEPRGQHPWSQPPDPQHEPYEPPVREPVFNAPWPALLLTAVILGGYALQSRFPLEAVVGAFAFSPAALEAGRWGTLLSALFLHGSWAHAVMNGAFALAFGTPVARFFGTKASGALAFYAFYLACGAASSLGYAVVHPGSPGWLVGASGAVSGLMGAAARLIAGRGQLGGMFSSVVLGMGAAWVIVNLLIGVLGSGFVPGSGGAAIAWEAHVAGFVAGVLLSGPFAWMARRR